MTGTPSPTVAPWVLAVSDLRKHFVLHHVDGRRVEALRGVDLTVGGGEHVALAGTSGAGKSSLLKCVYRTYLPSAGSVRLRDADGTVVELTGLPDHELAMLRGRRLGYVSQFLHAPARRSPFEIVSRAARQRGLERSVAREAAAVALRRLRLDEALWDVYASMLSGGERQRVNLAAGTVSPPGVLLLDEPVSALDPTNRGAALDLIADLTSHGVAVLSVFHDLAAIEQVADRVVLLDSGRVVAEGHPGDIVPRLGGVAR